MRRGWFGDNHRHYLAAKGIKTKYNALKYDSKFGDAIRGFGGKVQQYKEEYYRTAPAREAQRESLQLAMEQQRVLAKPLTEEERIQQKEIMELAQQRHMKDQTLRANEAKLKKEKQNVERAKNKLEFSLRKKMAAGETIAQQEAIEYQRLTDNLAQLNAAIDEINRKYREQLVGGPIPNEWQGLAQR